MQHAELLSSILKNVSQTSSYKNFDVIYLDNPVNEGRSSYLFLVLRVDSSRRPAVGSHFTLGGGGRRGLAAD